MPDSKQLRVFLCHASEDQKIVRKVYERLKDDGIDAWLDKENLLPGQDWQREIPRIVKKSDVVLVFLSKHTVEKEGYFQKEIRLALETADQMPEGRIYIVPVRLEECEVPQSLSKWHWVDIFKSDGYKKMMTTLTARAKDISAKAGNISSNQSVDFPPVIEAPEKQVSASSQVAGAKKDSSPKKKFNPTIIAAIIGAIATMLAGVLSSPLLEKLISPPSTSVTIVYDGKSEKYNVPANSLISDILTTTGIALGNLDRVEPPLTESITSNMVIKVIRVREEFTEQQLDIPFSQEVVRNGVIPEGETRLIQPGTIGTQEITTRLLYEDNVKISESIIKTVILQESLPEIIMVGVKNLDLGKIVYLSEGNAWMVDDPKDPFNTRNLVVNNGDLDGRIFLMSPDGKWLLFTRKSTKPTSEEINTLWVKNLSEENAPIIDLHISNVVHFASFVPNTETTISYSTVEPRETAPGWQANNDLYTLKFSAFGATGESIQIIEPNSGGVYGWWGTSFIWSQDGQILAYARPDGVGKVDLNEKTFNKLMGFVPLQTHSDWALIPSLSLSPDKKYLYFVSHNTTSANFSPEESPFFDISIFSFEDNSISNIKNTGMFAYPTASPYRLLNGNITTQVAYLQSENPEQSDTSRYRLYTMDVDGSNQQAIFPMLENAPRLEPQQPIWSPVQTGQDNLIAIIYEGNIWLLDIFSGEANKITTDGFVAVLDWK